MKKSSAAHTIRAAPTALLLYCFVIAWASLEKRVVFALNGIFSIKNYDLMNLRRFASPEGGMVRIEDYKWCSSVMKFPMHLIHHLNESFYYNGMELHYSQSDFSFSLVVSRATLKDSFHNPIVPISLSRALLGKILLNGCVELCLSTFFQHSSPGSLVSCLCRTLFKHITMKTMRRFWVEWKINVECKMRKNTWCHKNIMHLFNGSFLLGTSI